MARDRGITCGYVSNGNGTPEVLKYIRPYVDLYKVDLKGFADKHYRERTVAGQMEAACKAAGIVDPIKPHDLRRTWATRCAGAGFSNEQIDRLLNHVTAKKVTRTYNRHQYRVENAAIWTKVANAIMSVIDGKSAEVVTLRNVS